MRTIILDQYGHQPILKRLAGNALTCLAWLFWIYLWIPLFKAILQFITHPEGIDTTNPLFGLATSLGNHASMVLVMMLAFLAWSLLQWLGKTHRYSLLQANAGAVSAFNAPHTKYDIKSWRQAQSLRVKHDDSNGNISQVEITD